MSRTVATAFSTLVGVGLLGVAIANVAGCGSLGMADPPVPDSDGGTSATSQDDVTGGESSQECGIPPAVDTILKQRCQSCHSANPQYGAPNSLVTYDDLNKPGIDGKKVYERIQVRIHQDVNPMPQVPNPRLTTEEMKAIDDWVAAGAPKSTESCGTDQPASDLGPKPLECQPGEKMITVKPGSVFKVGKDVRDLYTCAGVELPIDKSMHITAIAPHIDKKEVIHHVLLMQSLLPVPQTPYICAGVGTQQWKLISGWAPGSDNMVLPPEAGFPVDKSTHWVIQVHYNNANGKQEFEDASGFDMCVTENKRKYDAGVVAFGSMAFAIPPRAKYQVTCSVPLPPVISSGVTLFRSWPHMHQLAYGMKTTVKPIVGGTEQVLVDEQNYSFQNQISHNANLKVNPGDIITTTCRWNNTTDRTITWGENTSDEMCYNYTAYYPVIGGSGELSLNWMTGSANPVCNSGVEK